MKKDNNIINLHEKHEVAKLEDGEDQTLTTPRIKPPECRVYKRRWAILILFMLFGFITCMSWIQYSIVANIMMRYYNVSSHAIDWTSMIFMLVYIPLVFPASYFLDKKGLRNTTLIGTFIAAVGSWIKVVGATPDGFVVAFVGHTIVGASQVFLLSVPPRLAAVWFGADQVSTACSLAVFGNLLGVATGFFLPPVIIRNHADVDSIGYDLSIFCYGMAAFTTLLFFAVLFIFQEAPKLPPSVAQLLKRESLNEGFLESIKRLAFNQGYLLLLIAYGINLGISNALCTLLNQLIMKYFEDGEQFAGQVGLILTLSGMACIILAGIVLDKTHKYKETTLIIYICSLLGLFAFSHVLALSSKILVYITAVTLGFFIGGYGPVGFELAMELTYPEPEGTASGILLFVCQTVSFLFTLIYSLLIEAVGDYWANMALCAALFVGCVLTAMIPPNMRRQDATRTKTCVDLLGQ